VDINCFDARSYLNSQKNHVSNGEDSSVDIVPGNKDMMILETSKNEDSQNNFGTTKNEQNILKQFLVMTSTAVSLPLGTSSPVKDLMKMSLKLLVPGQFSHRSFVYKLQMGAENEISLFPSEKEIEEKPKSFLRKRFYNTRVLGLTMNFANYIKKKLEIKNMHLSKGDKSLIIELKVKGCLEINDFQLAANGLSLSFSKKDISTSGEDFLAKLTLHPIDAKDLGSYQGDFKLSVLCDYTINDDNKPYSNLIRSKVDPNYRVIQSNSTWSSTRVSQLHVHNFSADLVKAHKEKSDKLDDMFFRQIDDVVNLVVPQKFFAYIKDGFYLLFEYDFQVRKIVYSIRNLDEKISAKNIRFEDFSWEVKYFYENFDHSTVEHERDFSLNEEFFTGSSRSLEGFFSLLGKSLHVISVNQDNFYSTKSLIRVFEKEGDYGPQSGLPIPPEGLNCFSNDLTDSSDVFYISIKPSGDLSDAHEIHFFTLKKDLTRVRLAFFDIEIPLYEDQTFNGFEQDSLSRFSKFIGIIEDNFLNLLGQKIEIKYKGNRKYQDCHLGRRNPFYHTKDILLLWGQKHNFYDNISKQNQTSFKGWVLFMVILFALICVGFVLILKYSKTIKERVFENGEKTKIEAI
jgi:hypothetical protein